VTAPNDFLERALGGVIHLAHEIGGGLGLPLKFREPRRSPANDFCGFGRGSDTGREKSALI
jgi:hypothetical protein